MFTVFCWTLTHRASALPSAHTEILATVQAGPYTKSNLLDGKVEHVEIRFPAPSSPVALCWGDVTAQCSPQRGLTIAETSVLGNIISPLCQQGAHAPDPHFRVCTPKICQEVSLWIGCTEASVAINSKHIIAAGFAWRRPWPQRSLQVRLHPLGRVSLWVMLCFPARFLLEFYFYLRLFLVWLKVWLSLDRRLL